MNEFYIKDVEALTGIKPHTLRMWEQRYNFIKPKRTGTNIRYYDNNDLKVLLNVALLNKNGIKISKIVKLTKEEIDRTILKFTTEKDIKCFQLHELIGCMLRLDECNFEQIIRNCFSMNGVTYTMTNLIFPFLEHIGKLWMSGSVNSSYEHYISNMIRSKLIVATDRLGYNNNTKIIKKKFLLFLPESECHEIGLLFANYYIRAAGHHTLYLGQGLPVDDLEIIINTYKPEYLFTSLTTAMPQKKLDCLFKELSAGENNFPVLITGRIVTANKVDMPANFHVIRNITDLDSYV